MAERGKPPAGRTRPLLARVALAAVLVMGDAATARANTFGGVGLVSCGVWTADRQELLAGNAGTLGYQSALREMEWVLGFLSGIASIGPSFDPLNEVEAEHVWAWIDDYCDDHPLEKIAEAATSFTAAHPR
jgi:hypothetical protein